MTVTPVDLFEYASGENPEILAPLEYRYELTTAATDLAGNELETEHSVSFNTLRRVRAALASVPDLTGYVRADGDVSPACYVGDSSTTANAWYRCGVTFELDRIHPTAVELEGATLYVTQNNHRGDGDSKLDPYDDLGALLLMDVEYDIKSVASYSSPGTQVGAESLATPAQMEFSLRDEVQGDFDARGPTGRTQFRFQFSVDSDFDDRVDWMQLSNRTLEVTYLLP